jgi:hypothetical protein
MQRCMSRHGPVNSSRAVTRRAEPRRVASNREEYRDVMRRGPHAQACGKAGQQAVGICRKNARQERGAPGARGYYVASRKSLHASAVKGTGCAGPTRAFSSVGESARLITVRSVVRIHKGPRSYPLGDVAQSGRAPALQAGGRRFEPGHLHGQRPHRSTAGLKVGRLYVDTRIASLREHWTVSVVQRSSENPQ